MGNLTGDNQPGGVVPQQPKKSKEQLNSDLLAIEEARFLDEKDNQSLLIRPKQPKLNSLLG